MFTYINYANIHVNIWVLFHTGMLGQFLVVQVNYCFLRQAKDGISLLHSIFDMVSTTGCLPYHQPFSQIVWSAFYCGPGIRKSLTWFVLAKKSSILFAFYGGNNTGGLSCSLYWFRNSSLLLSLFFSRQTWLRVWQEREWWSRMCVCENSVMECRGETRGYI